VKPAPKATAHDGAICAYRVITLSPARLERWMQLGSFLAVLAVLAVLTAAQGRLQSRITEFLVLPTFAVVIYTVFRDPFGNSANLRSIVSYRYLGMTPFGIALDTLCVPSLRRTRMPAALAPSVLSPLLRVTSILYVVGVAEASTLIAIFLSSGADSSSRRFIAKRCCHRAAVILSRHRNRFPSKLPKVP
jgi:hypothetical protein